MKRSMKILLAVIVIVLVAITAGVAFNTGDAPVLVEKHQYSEKQASDRLETLKAAQSEHKVEVIPMKFFVEELCTDDGTFAVTAITTMREEDIAAVSFRAMDRCRAAASSRATVSSRAAETCLPRLPAEAAQRPAWGTHPPRS